MANKLRGGAEHHEHAVWEASRAFEEAFEDMRSAATCRRAFSAMQRATASIGRMSDDVHSFNSQNAHWDVLEVAREKLTKAYTRFYNKCQRRPS